MKNPRDTIKGESKVAYAAFLAYVDNRDLESAYGSFMQSNPNALTTMKAFLKWASRFKWQARVNAIDADDELTITRETRREGLGNSLTAEQVAKELYTTCMEEMELKKGDMTHRDIGKYLDIATKIGERWNKQPETPVVVNVDNNISQTVDIDPELLRALGRKLVEEDEIGQD